MKFLHVTALLLAFTVGCASVDTIETVDATALPIYGSDPLYHTHYVGSDNDYHHFVTQHGLSGERLQIPVDVAEIEPAAFSRELDQSTFVVSAESGVVTIFDPRRKP
jgi:hypothetical protein